MRRASIVRSGGGGGAPVGSPLRARAAAAFTASCCDRRYTRSCAPAHAPVFGGGALGSDVHPAAARSARAARRARAGGGGRTRGACARSLVGGPLRAGLSGAAGGTAAGGGNLDHRDLPAGRSGTEHAARAGHLAAPGVRAGHARCRPAVAALPPWRARALVVGGEGRVQLLA